MPGDFLRMMKEPGHGTRQFNWHRNQFIKMLAFDPAVKRALGRKFYAYVEVLTYHWIIISVTNELVC